MIGKMPRGPLRQHVRSMTRPYSVDRERSRNEMKPGGGKQFDRDAATVDMYVYGETGRDTLDAVGELDQGSMQAVALAEADVQDGDRLDYGDRRYEVVEPIRFIPDRDDPAILQIPLERVPEQARL